MRSSEREAKSLSGVRRGARRNKRRRRLYNIAYQLFRNTVYVSCRYIVLAVQLTSYFIIHTHTQIQTCVYVYIYITFINFFNVKSREIIVLHFRHWSRWPVVVVARTSYDVKQTPVVRVPTRANYTYPHVVATGYPKRKFRRRICTYVTSQSWNERKLIFDIYKFENNLLYGKRTFFRIIAFTLNVHNKRYTE